MERTYSHTQPLALITPGKRVRLVQINAGHTLTHRLAELGLTPGVELEILQNEGGPLLINVRDSRLALGRGMAHRVLVKQIEED
jgi:Fe2+ transport system protein FeoA